MDWTGRRPHLAGSLGKAVLDRLSNTSSKRRTAPKAGKRRPRPSSD